MAISCQPQDLNAAAVCFTCIPDPLKGLVNIYLLNQISGVNAAPGNLPALSPQFQIFQGSPALAAEVYLLAKIAGASTDPSTLAGQAACFWCKNENFLQEVTTFLLASIAGGSTNAQTLMTAASSYTVLFGLQWRVELQLICQWALNKGMIASCNPQALMNNSKCLNDCLGVFTLMSIRAYLLCQLALNGVGGPNLIPGGSIFVGGQFNINVIPNTLYNVCWGANETSVQLPVSGQIIPSTGFGTCSQICTHGDSVMEFFGAAGATVTAKLTLSAIPCVPRPTGFTFLNNSDFATAQATWDVPPAGIAYTELWTAPDPFGFSFTLAATVNAPGTTASVAQPAVANFKWGIVRWVNTSGQKSGFTAIGPEVSSLNKSLTSYWNMNDAALATRLDSVGANNLADNVPDVLAPAGLIGKCADFATNFGAINEGLSIASNATLAIAPGDSFFISIWININPIGSLNAGIIGKFTASQEYLLYIDAVGAPLKLDWGVENAANNAFVTMTIASGMTTNVWHHVVCGFDNANNQAFAFFDNGARQNNAVVGVNNGNARFTLGNYGAAGTQNWSGLIDETAFWKRVPPTAAEVAWLFNAGAGRTLPL